MSAERLITVRMPDRTNQRFAKPPPYVATLNTSDERGHEARLETWKWLGQDGTDYVDTEIVYDWQADDQTADLVQWYTQTKGALG
jgi:hypothetical protein